MSYSYLGVGQFYETSAGVFCEFSLNLKNKFLRFLDSAIVGLLILCFLLFECYLIKEILVYVGLFPGILVLTFISF